MTDLQSLVGPTYAGLAGRLEDAPAEVWDAASLCAGWQVRHVVAHVTMPARMTTEQFGSELAASGGDFTALSEAIAARDADLPVTEHLTHLRSPGLHEWQPPGGGAAGALSHAVIHTLDVTVPVGWPRPSDEAVLAVLDQLTATGGSTFGLDLAGLRLEADDLDWSRGGAGGRVVRADAGSLVSLLGGRTLPDGRSLPRRG